MEMDERFSKINKDPRFKKVPRKFRKVKIDSRFKSMFTDKKFQTTYSVDKRGRPLNQTSSEHLEKYYDLSDSSENDDDDDVGNSKNGEQKQVRKNLSGPALGGEKAKKPKNKLSETCANEEVETQINRKIKSIRASVEAEDSSTSSDEEPPELVDIRGNSLADAKGYSTNEDSEGSEGDDSEDQGLEHDWGELDQDARRKENAETRRLAVCNLDWDKVNANDLFVLFNSFVRQEGSIQSIKIYPSEYGLERMKEEDVSGPKELKDVSGDFEDEEIDEDNVEGSAYHMEKLRQYQIQRFKYYYAVVECDSAETADKIYEECDNQEFELSATRLDLRFILEETEFDRDPVSVATGGASLENYTPTDVSSTALHQSRVKLTWDESDPKRMQLMTKAFSKEQLEDMDVQAYLASSSGEENDDADAQKRDVNDDGNVDDEDSRVQKYRALMREIEVKEKEDDSGQDMEISWAPALGEDTSLSSTKRTQKKKAHQASVNDAEETEESDTFEYSDDQSNDGNGKQTSNEEFEKKKDRAGTRKKERRKRRREKNILTEKEEEQAKKSREELELLLTEDKEEKQHFNLKDILEKEKRKKKKKLKGKKSALQETEDTFQLDVEDERFSALYSSHHFALDPSDSQFKKTKATEAILKEKQRRKNDPSDQEKEKSNKKSQSSAPSTVDPSLSALVKSVKSRTEKHKENKRSKRGKWNR